MERNALQAQLDALPYWSPRYQELANRITILNCEIFLAEKTEANRKA